MNILYSASGVMAVLFSILLLSKKKKSLADYILALWFLLILLIIVTVYVNHNGIEIWQGLFEFTDASVFLHGPVIWLYTLALIKKDFRWKRKFTIHFLPFLACLIYLFVPVIQGQNIPPLGRNFVLISKMLLLLGYGIVVLKEIYHHNKEIVNFFSNLEKVQLNWLKILIWSLIIIWVIASISQFLYSYKSVQIPQYGGYFTNAALCIMVLIVGYFGLKQSAVFSSEINTIETYHLKDRNDLAKGGNENISESENVKPSIPKEKYNLLLNYMNEQKPYLNGNLTLFELSKQIEFAPSQLSSIINQQGKTNFFDFINTFRVEEVKERIRNKEYINKTLLAIAYDSGFNSKSSFNRVFKNMTGMTPKEFMMSERN